MPHFTLKIEADNEAFTPAPLYEVGGILYQLGHHLMSRGSDLGDEGKLRDVNGNTVGEWKYEEDV